MANSIETSYSGVFLNTKLNSVLQDLNLEMAGTSLSSKEEVFSIFTKKIRDFYSKIDGSSFRYNSIIAGADPSTFKINTDYFSIYDDLSILYLGLKELRNNLATNYNTLSGMLYKIKSDIAECSSTLMDYKLQNSEAGNSAYTDSFFNLSKVETDQSKYSKEKCFIDTFNNNAVLPLESESKSGKIKRMQIADGSVGTSGNNQEIGSLARDNIRLALDNNIDTWFEFEQVGSKELESPTILNLKIELEEEIFFNILDIITTEMPNGSYPAVLEIKGSLDGSNFFDLKELFLGSFSYDSIGNKVIQLGEDPENPTGQNILYFRPRKIKYLTIKLIEDSSYFIRASSGIKYRRAIGIRELKLKSQKFKNEGQLVTSTFLSNKEISKIGLFTEEHSPENFKSTFNYFISVDNGENWDPISPSQKIKEKIPEILNYNIDYLESSKKTEFPISNFKLKCDFKIEEGAENTSINSGFTRKQKTEFANFSAGSKSVSLNQKPFGQVYLYRTNFGSVGGEQQFIIPYESLTEMKDRYSIQLPLDTFPPSSIQADQEILNIDGYLWTRVESISSQVDSMTSVYEFDYLNNIITFHKTISGTKHGKLPLKSIKFKLKKELVSLLALEGKTEIKLRRSHDGIKENISIYSIGEEPLYADFKLRNLASVHRTQIEEIDSFQILLDDSGILQVEKDFINGVMELSDNGDYSIDKKRGVIYTYSSLSSTDEIKVKISYKKKTKINFDIEDGQIFTTDSLNKTKQIFKMQVVNPSYVINLGYKNIQKNSLEFIELPAGVTEEVQLEKMEYEFNLPQTSGKYAIDYIEGYVYFQEKVFGSFSGVLINSNYFAEYNLSQKINESDYTILYEDSSIEFTDKFVTDFFNKTNSEIQGASLLKINYTYTEQVQESLADLLPYVTPFIREYKIVTTPKEQL